MLEKLDENLFHRLRKQIFDFSGSLEEFFS